MWLHFKIFLLYKVAMFAPYQNNKGGKAMAYTLNLLEQMANGLAKQFGLTVRS